MTVINKYLEHCREADSAEILSLQTLDFLKNYNCDSTLFYHEPTARPLKILGTTNTKTLQEWCNLFSTFDFKTQKRIISNAKYDYYFSDIDFERAPFFLFAVESGQKEAKEILSTWYSLISMHKEAYQASRQEAENHYGNLISQFMHDIQSLMDSNKSEDPNMLRRINYQKKLNKDLLFYIRDFDLFKSRIPVSTFIKDSLKLIELDPAAINTIIKDKNLSIDIDVELFANTFNVVVSNALRATDNDLSKIDIEVYATDSTSPFLKHDWIVFEVRDSGKGIAEEFEPFISKPFFTTHKHNGHTGFGLTNAQKILQAHNGFLDIGTGNGTAVKMYIPGTSNEK